MGWKMAALVAALFGLSALDWFVASLLGSHHGLDIALLSTGACMGVGVGGLLRTQAT